MVMGPTHATSGAVAWLVAGGVTTAAFGYSQSPAELAVYTTVCAGAALLPDLDVSGRVFRNRGGATAARVFGVVSLFVAECVEKLSLGIYLLTRSRKDPRRRNGHRTFTHTLVFAVLLGALLSFLVSKFGKPVMLATLFVTIGLAIRGVMAEWVKKRGWLVTTVLSLVVTVFAFAVLPADGYPLLGVAVGMGCLVHILGDMITRHGCPLLWPIRIKGRNWYMISLPDRYAIRAGGKFERTVLLPGLTVVACLAALWQLPALREILFSVTDTPPPPVEAGD
ncbi:MAG TPA: metal-dependent hydrolase [Natronosporangium sp.]|nr:metal-dependent hydrolase [Natronosporangium sp.]